VLGLFLLDVGANSVSKLEGKNVTDFNSYSLLEVSLPKRHLDRLDVLDEGLFHGEMMNPMT
jgi:hypothetical protein